MKKNIAAVIIILYIIVFICTSFYVEVVFDANCKGFLKKAADSSSHITASEQLGHAIAYCEANNLTSGRSHAFYYTQECDVEFWYNNLVEQKRSLDSITSETTDLEISNRMIRMREVLTDVSSDGTSITVPHNIAFYPYQFVFWILAVSAVPVTAIFTFIILIEVL